MRSRLALILAVPFAGALAACEDYVTGTSAIPPAPTGLYYRLEPSGDPDRPLGIVLRWNAVNDPALAVYNIYSRPSTSAEWGLRGSTTSPSFHDDGVPHLEYFVTAANADGDESDGSASVFIDELLRLQQPLSLTSISLDRAIHLSWLDNAYQADPAGFSAYRVYSASYDLDNNLCLNDWTLEGTTVAPTFLAAELVNGAPRCFGVTALSIEGFESLWSALRYDTPRPDGEDVLVYTAAADPLRSGFRFFLDANGDGQAGPFELGLVSASVSGQMDFVLQADASGNMQIVPQRANTTFQRFGTQPIRDLTAIDIAPVAGYGSAALLAQPRFGYVFQMNEGDGFYRYGAIRVVATGPNYVIFDWSYQTDRGNPELIRTVD